MISDDLMIIIYTALLVLMCYVAYRTRVYGILVVAPGAVAWMLFYLWTHFGWWPSLDVAVQWSRVAQLLFTGGLAVGLVLMCKKACAEWTH